MANTMLSKRQFLIVMQLWPWQKNSSSCNCVVRVGDQFFRTKEEFFRVFSITPKFYDHYHHWLIRLSVCGSIRKKEGKGENYVRIRIE